MKKKVLFILPSLVIGGMERVQITIANMLVNHDYDVTIMTLGQGDDLINELDQKVKLLYKPLKKHFGNRIPYIRHKFYDDGMWETRASAKQLHDYYVGEEEYDVEIAFFRGLPIKIVSGARTSVRIAWVHNDFRRAPGFSNNFKNLKDVYNAYASYDHVVCVSNQAVEGFIKTIGDTKNLVTIYNMIPVDHINSLAMDSPQPQFSNSKLNAIIVARLLDKAKGHIRLIRTVAKLFHEGTDIHLTVIGDGPDKETIMKCIIENNADPCVSMIGNQKNPYPFIKNADLLVCASYYEGFPLNVCESIVLGTPVLSTNCTGPNEILDYGKYGMIVENSEDGLYYGLKRLSENTSLLLDYRNRAFLRRSFFDEEKVLNQITDLFE